MSRRLVAQFGLMAALVLAVGMSQVHAQTLTFEGLQNLEPILNYYDGGLGGLGSGPGPNYGITFTSDSLAIIDASSGGSGNTASDPSGDTVAFFLSGAGDVMNDPTGFTTGFSFYYAAVNNPGVVTVWSGTDGTGSLLATLNLPITGNACNPIANFSCWDPAGAAFAGTAESAIFSGTANQIAFDNITINSATPGGGVPEPGTLVMLGTGLLGLAGFAKRKFLS